MPLGNTGLESLSHAAMQKRGTECTDNPEIKKTHKQFSAASEAAHASLPEGLIECERQLHELSLLLSDLEDLKHDTPDEYNVAVEHVLEDAEKIDRMLRFYSRKRGSDTGRLTINEALLDLLLKLRRIDPDRFPRDLVEFTDDDLRALAFPAERWFWSEIIREARIAEYDPERFRRLFAAQYTPEALAELRAQCDEIGNTNRKMGDMHAPDYLKAWEAIETALFVPDKRQTDEPGATNG